MAPTIHCVRHAQGFHNLGSEFHGLPDPRLTPVGEEQCLALKEARFSDQSSISLIAASPLSRTIQTAYITFGPSLENSKNILAIPDAQETSDFPCDTGSDLSALQKTCARDGWPVDLSLVQDGWNKKIVGSRYSPASHAIKKRARDARRLLREKVRELVAVGDHDAQVVLVTHGGYLHYFTEDWEDSNKLLGTGWQNCETRAYNFEYGIDGDDENASLVETMDSRRTRGLTHPMHPKDRQHELFQQSMSNWESQGLQNASMIDLENGEVDRGSTGQEPAPQTTESNAGGIKVCA